MPTANQTAAPAAPATPRTSEEIERELAAWSPEDDEGGEPAPAPAEPAKAEPATPFAEPTPEEKEATAKGWRPRDQYTGDPALWVDASVFLDRGRKFNSTLQHDLAKANARIAAIEKSAAAFKQYSEERIAAKEAELANAIIELRKERTEAIRYGDDAEVLVIEDRIDILKEEQKSQKAAVEAAKAAEAAAALEADRKRPGGPEDPVLLDWIADGNEWFKDDPKLSAYGIAVGQDLIKNGEKLRGREFLDKLTAIMKEEFPAKFGNPLRDRPGAVEAAGKAGTSATTGKTSRDLPPEDRALMKQFVKEGWVTEEKFVKDYFARNS